jgi:NRAMP (natural resistance-associated macrophage protein)-like metal ion transporter
MPPSSNSRKSFFSSLGPGIITGASDDDPSGIGTYSIAGAAFGFATLWTALFTLPLMVVVQFLCAKIGMVSGRGLAGVLRTYYPRKVLYAATASLVVANTINAGVDIGAIAAGINLIVPVPVGFLIVPIALGIVALQIRGRYRQIVNVFKWLTLSLFAYVATAFLAKPDWSGVLRGTFVPELRLDHDYLVTLVAILGTTISPYLFFWQASQEVEEEISEGKTSVAQRTGASDADLSRAKWDTITGMFISNVVFYFVILACAATLHASGNTEISSAAQAAEALRPLAGDAATYLFAVGIVGAGFLAVPVLTGSSAYAVAETFGWKYGLDTKPWEARQFYAVIAISTLLGALIDFAGINPISALLWTSVINGVLSPPLLVLIMLVSGNRKIMGRRVNGRFTGAVGWLATAVMFAAAIAMMATWG